MNRQPFVGLSPANQASVLIPGALPRAGGPEWENSSPRHALSPAGLSPRRSTPCPADRTDLGVGGATLCQSPPSVHPPPLTAVLGYQGTPVLQRTPAPWLHPSTALIAPSTCQGSRAPGTAMAPPRAHTVWPRDPSAARCWAGPGAVPSQALAPCLQPHGLSLGKVWFLVFLPFQWLPKLPVPRNRPSSS